jgi:hypothetical protein
MSNTTLKRLNSIRRADNVDDQQGSPAIQGALIASTTQEELQVYFLSRMRQMIWGESGPEHWFDDFFSEGILSLKELSAASSAVQVRVGVSLVGPKDGANRIFRTTPDHFVHDLSGNGKTIEIWHNGRRLAQASAPNPEFGDFTVEESGGVGTGYDTINLLTFAPVGRSSLLANYQRV